MSDNSKSAEEILSLKMPRPKDGERHGRMRLIGEKCAWRGLI